MFDNIVLHVPHSSADFSFAGEKYSRLFSEKWRKAARPLIDWYTDELFVPEYPEDCIRPLVFNTCRTLCDVERMANDPLEARGLGITASKLLRTYECHNGPRIKCDASIRQLWLDHQYRLASLVSLSDNSILIDCHSFSNEPTLLVPDPSEARGIDICIGVNDDLTTPSVALMDLVRSHFEQSGYRVAVNVPFSNSKTVDVPVRYTSLMIEVNKALYMDERTLEKTEGFARLQECIQSLYGRILCLR